MHVRVTEAEKTALEKLALTRDVPASQIIREAVKDLVTGSGISLKK
jgi:predicted transcriptional regulator